MKCPQQANLYREELDFFWLLDLRGGALVGENYGIRDFFLRW
jgi:hypothetical protein